MLPSNTMLIWRKPHAFTVVVMICTPAKYMYVNVWRRLEYIAPIVRRAIEMEEFIQFNIAYRTRLLNFPRHITCAFV